MKVWLYMGVKVMIVKLKLNWINFFFNFQVIQLLKEMFISGLDATLMILYPFGFTILNHVIHPGEFSGFCNSSEIS